MLLWVEICLQKFICWSLNPQDFRTWLYLELGSLQRSSSYNEIIRAGSSPIRLMSLKRGEIWRQTLTQGDHHMSMKMDIYQPRRKARTDCLTALRCTKLSDTLISYFEPPEPRDNKSLWLKPPWFGGLCYGSPSRLLHMCTHTQAHAHRGSHAHSLTAGN